MTNTLLWLACLISGGIGFALVYLKGWRLVVAMILATAVGVLLSLIIMLAIPKEDSSPWFQVELAVNGSLALIFAGAGAAIAFALRESRPRD